MGFDWDFDVVTKQPLVKDSEPKPYHGRLPPIERAVHNSPPPLDDVGGIEDHLFDPFDPSRSLPPNPKQAYGDRKVPLHLVPPALLIYAALAFKEGARKYGPYNWRASRVETETYVGAALRHILAYQDGENIDPESRLPHLAHAIACLAILADCTEGLFLIDNRPHSGPAGELIRSLAT